MTATLLKASPPAPGASPAAGGRLPVEVARHRLGGTLPRDGAWSWLWTGLVTAIALILRLVGLANPPAKIFDEVYYAKDAYDLLTGGVELNSNGTGPGFVAHPPLGKWCIALGEWLFGNTSMGWRFPAAIAGALSVLLLVRVGRRLFRSTLLGCVAGLLLALDGLHFVSSRVALLDIYLMLFLLAAFACLAIDRDWRRRQLLRQLVDQVTAEQATTVGTAGNSVPRRMSGWLRSVLWWRLAAAVFTGAALAVKWSAAWYVIAFLLVAFLWEVGARRAAGARSVLLRAVRRELGWAVAFAGVMVATYLAAWTGWFLSDSGWDRHWAETTGNSVAWIPDALVNLWHYHDAVLDFHTALTAKHTYQSTPWSWLFLGRPVSYYYSGEGPCGAAQCSAEVIALGTPLLWWSFLPALAATGLRWLTRRDGIAGAILLCAAAGIVPWMFFPGRTMFFFYTLPALPFLILAVTIALGMTLGPAQATFRRRLVGAWVVAGYVGAIAVTFAYFYPIYVGSQLTYAEWYSRMWLSSWI